jgi:hypothetical protein
MYVDRGWWRVRIPIVFIFTIVVVAVVALLIDVSGTEIFEAGTHIKPKAALKSLTISIVLTLRTTASGVGL